MDDKLNELFSNNLRNYLSLNNKNQTDLANFMQVSSATASDWCNGNKMPRTDKLLALAKWLNCDISDLLTKDNGEKESYYYDDDAREAAEFLHSNPDYKVLFDAARNVSADDINTVKNIIDHYRKKDD